jgi:LysR family transcriptional activator of nhaA
VVRGLLEPLRSLPQPVRIVCREDKPERLLADLSLHALDVVIADAPVGPGVSVRAFSHLLGECGTSLFAARRLAARWRRGFPGSLGGAPMLLPTENTALRRALDVWFEDQGLRPSIVAEVEDSALLKVLGQDGLGVFPAASAIEQQVKEQYGVQVVGRLPTVRERFYAITVERRLKHPAVVAISKAARQELFG